MNQPYSFTAALIRALKSDADMSETVRQWLDEPSEDRVMAFAECLRLDFLERYRIVTNCEAADFEQVLAVDLMNLIESHIAWGRVARKLLHHFTALPRIIHPRPERFELPPAWLTQSN